MQKASNFDITDVSRYRSNLRRCYNARTKRHVFGVGSRSATRLGGVGFGLELSGRVQVKVGRGRGQPPSFLWRLNQCERRTLRIISCFSSPSSPMSMIIGAHNGVYTGGEEEPPWKRSSGGYYRHVVFKQATLCTRHAGTAQFSRA